MLTAFCTVLAQAPAAAERGLEDAQTFCAAVSGSALLPPEPRKGLQGPAATSPGAVTQPWPLLPWAAVPAPPHLFLPRHPALRQGRIPGRQHWAAGRGGQPVPRGSSFSLASKASAAAGRRPSTTSPSGWEQGAGLCHTSSSPKSGCEGQGFSWALQQKGEPDPRCQSSPLPVA